MKRIVAAILALVIVFMIFLGFAYMLLSRAEEGYPEVVIYSGELGYNANITIGKPYVYIDFDVESTEGHKDLILHFTEGEG